MLNRIDINRHRRRIRYREVRYRYCWCGNVQTGSHHEGTSHQKLEQKLRLTLRAVSDPRCHVRYHCRLLPSYLRPHRPGPVAPWNWKRIQLVQWFHASGLRCLCRLHRSRSWLHDWYCRRQGRPLVHGAVSCIRRHGSDSHFRRSFGSLRSHCRSDPEHQVQGLNADSDSTKTKWRNTNDILATPFDIVTPLYIKRGERRDVG
ncbi:hypothetical protein CCHR01_10715 [Colletotrichum chrysophilum]|uniref:Uncharacterized protein n=1 Tax=Colletotrichum chrysophilum TaxID=1836956 RepID=A0AAD9EGJ4_9PEZI|nr:hypothetical protein CCHR01_10715 [Colletotrichum chrysophilum]